MEALAREVGRGTGSSYGMTRGEELAVFRVPSTTCDDPELAALLERERMTEPGAAKEAIQEQRKGLEDASLADSICLPPIFTGR